jgi:hypothetical protein
MKFTLELSQRLYGYASYTKEEVCPSSIVHKRVSAGTIPHYALSIALQNTFYAAVLPESLRGPTATEIIHPLLATVFSLLGADTGMYVA